MSHTDHEPEPTTEGLTRRERLERRAERREEWAESRERRAAQDRAASSQAVAGIPLGQPVLVGHHSQRRHERALERSRNAMDRAAESDRMAERHRTKAGNIRAHLDTAVFSDDPDAIERLTERIRRREERRTRMKQINAWLRKRSGIKRKDLGWDRDAETVGKARDALVRAADALNLTERERQELAAALDFSGAVGYPSYALGNLSASIRRDRKRRDALQAKALDG